MSDILETMLAAVPDSYQKTVGFPIYDILAAAAIRMGGTEELLAHIKAMLDPDNLTGDDLDAYIYPRTGQVRNAATKAVGVLTVTGTGTITAGDLFESEGQRHGGNPMHDRRDSGQSPRRKRDHDAGAAGGDRQCVQFGHNP